MRTSHSHPLQIASVQAQPGFGHVGITFCPGKKQPSGLTGGWDRDLGLDLQAIREFGATAVVTLIEQHEVETLQVNNGRGDFAPTHGLAALAHPGHLGTRS